MMNTSLPEEMVAYERQLKSSSEPINVWLRYLDWVSSQPRSLKQKYLPGILDRCVDYVCSSEATRKHANNEKLLATCYARAAQHESASKFFKSLYEKRIGAASADFFVHWATELESKDDVRSALKIYQLGLSSKAEPAEILSKRVDQMSSMLKISGYSPETSGKENVSSNSAKCDVSSASQALAAVSLGPAEKVEPVDPYVKMIYSANRTASIEEHLASMHHYQKFHGGTKSNAKKTLNEMPERIYRVYIRREFDLGFPEATSADVPAGGKLVAPFEVAGKGGPQMSLEELLLSRPKYTKKAELPVLAQSVMMDIEEDGSIFSKSVMAPPSMTESKLMTSNVDFSLSEPMAPPPPEEDTTFFNSTLSAPLQPSDRSVSQYAAPLPPPKPNKTFRALEETTVFTRQARREMSDLWFHGDTNVEESSGSEEKRPCDAGEFSATFPLEQRAPSPLPLPDAVVKPTFEIFEDSKPTFEILEDAKPAFEIFEESDVDGAQEAKDVVMDEKLESGAESPDEDPILKPTEPAFDVYVDPSCVEEPEPSKKPNDTWAPDEDFTLGFFHDRTKFQAIAKKKHLESTPMVRRGRTEEDEDAGDTVQMFKKPVPPPSTVTRPRARASLMPAMSPLVETSREYYQSSGSVSCKSRYSKSSSSSCSSEFDATNLRRSMAATTRLGAIKETGDSTLNMTDVTEVETCDSLRATLRLNPFNDTVKLRLAALCGRNVNDFPFLNQVRSTRYEDIVSESAIKLSDDQSHSIVAIRDLMFDGHEETNSLLIVARSDGPFVFVKLMEPPNRWETHCWAEFMSRSGLPPPKGAVLADNSVAFVELSLCRDMANETLANMNDFHVRHAVGGRISEVFVLGIVWNLVSLLEEFHSCQMIVANFPLENIFISGIPYCEKTSLSSVFIADLSSAIDMTQFPSGMKFKTSDLGDEPLEELKNLQEWSYELDYAGVVRVMFNLLYPGERFGVWKEDDGKLMGFYHFKRSYVFRKLWAELADILLNSTEGEDPLGKVKARIAEGTEINELPSEEQLRVFESSFQGPM